MRYDENTMPVYMGLESGSKILGISQYELRRGVKAGRYPHIRRGPQYLLNMPLLIRQLEEESRRAGK